MTLGQQVGNRFEHRNGLSCSEIEDEADEAQGQLQHLYAKVSRAHQWLVSALDHRAPGTISGRRGLIEDAEAELRELLGLDSTDEVDGDA